MISKTFYVAAMSVLPDEHVRQMFAAGFLQIPSRGGHHCLWLYPSHNQGGLGTCAL